MNVNGYSLTSTRLPASNCFDGNTNTMCHGGQGSGDTLTATISRSDVSRVRIYNRKDCCQDRIRHAEVKVGGQLCGIVQSTAAVIDISCPSPLSGNLVTVKTKNLLNLMQVEIFGFAAALYEFVHQGHCASGWDGGPNHQYSTILECRNNCASRSGMLYFAYRDGNNCACYSSCADDGNHDDYNAYKIIKVCVKSFAAWDGVNYSYWNAGWGVCSTYSTTNFGYCKYDQKFGYKANQVCSECQECRNSRRRGDDVQERH